MNAIYGIGWGGRKRRAIAGAAPLRLPASLGAAGLIEIGAIQPASADSTGNRDLLMVL